MTQGPAAPPRQSPRTTGTTRILLLVTLAGVTVFALSIGLVGYLVSSGDGGDVHDGSFLEVALQGELRDGPMRGGLFLEPDAVPPTVTELAGAIRHAATDDRIDGLYLRLDGPSGGWASFQEVRDSLLVLREAGKPCVAYAEAYSNGSYYLATACNHVVLAPAGVSMVTGLASSVTYYAGTFEKIGVDPEFEHVGDFKSAIEPYERSGPSEAASEAMNALFDSLYDQMVAGMAEARGLDPEQVRAWIDVPPLSPDRALEQGLVDVLAYPDQVRAHLATSAEEGWRERVTEADPESEEDDEGITKLSEYRKTVRKAQSTTGDVVAVVHAEGPIVSGEASGGLFGDQVLADRTFRSWMKKAREDDRVKSVVLRVNSPGGSGLASDMMWREIVRTRDAGKPVVVSMADYAASGGYYIAAPADWIVAQPGTLTGSIGVFGGKLNLAGTYEKLGMTQHTYRRGAESDIFSPTAPFSEGGRAAFRGFLSDFYDTFLDRVSEGRELTREEVHLVAQGRVWTGQQALERGLVDELGGLDVALARAAERADLTEYGVLRLPEQKGFFDLLMEDLAEASTPDLGTALWPVPDRAIADLVVLDRVLADGGVAALMPVRLLTQ